MEISVGFNLSLRVPLRINNSDRLRIFKLLLYTNRIYALKEFRSFLFEEKYLCIAESSR